MPSACSHPVCAGLPHALSLRLSTVCWPARYPLPAAVQFVLADTVPRASYIVPTQQLVLATYGELHAALVGRKEQLARIGDQEPLPFCIGLTGRDLLQGQSAELALPRLF